MMKQMALMIGLLAAQIPINPCGGGGGGESGPAGPPGPPGPAGPAGPAGSSAYPSIVPVSSGSTLAFNCANLELIPNPVACPSPITVTNTQGAGLVYVGVVPQCGPDGCAPIIHVGTQTAGDISCMGCAVDGAVNAEYSGEYAVAEASYYGGAWSPALSVLWSGYPALQQVILSGANASDCSVAQTVYQVVVTCN